jgi:muramoyltetrapeptide carboxypeptidase
MFSDPSVDAVLAVTGGFSALRVVDYLDYNLIKQNPKPFIGMSDNSIYQWTMLIHCGLVSFHGNNLHDAFGGYVATATLEEQAMWKSVYLDLLMKPSPYGAYPQLSLWESWRPGIAKGRLIGGNLKRVTSLIGTTHFPSMEMFHGALFFWEEIGESLYDISLNLHKWKHIGLFERIGGMIIGQPVWVNEYFQEIHHPTLEEAVMDIVKEYRFPILAQVDFGHNCSMLPLPIGIEAEMDTSKPAIVILEAAVE